MTIHKLHKPVLLCLMALSVIYAGNDLRADDAADAYQRGLKALDQDQLDQAALAFSEAIKLKPDEARYFGMRATALLRKGEYDQGLADLKTAIRLNPNDLGANYQPATNKELPPESLKHGEQQVLKMLEDRPAMAQYGRQSAFLRSWAARKFAGEDFGSLIDWDPTPPIHSDAEHLAPENNLHGCILIEPNYTSGPKQGQPRSFEELWAGAVFELHNINNAKQFVRLHEEAAQGKVSRHDFVAAMLKYEVLAAQQTRAFYVQKFLPFAARQKLPTDPALWFSNWWDQPDEALKNFTDKSSYPWQPYAREHDWITVERYWHRGRYKRAIPLLKQMCEQSDGEMSDHAEVHYWLGRCRMKLDEYDQAVEEFSASLRLEPHDPVVYRARARAYEKLNESEKAAADRKQAEELEKSKE
jgi:tetratricopeptide (TPR) repeat protein